MSRVVGIDVTATHVRAVLLRVAYRKTVVEALREVELSDFTTPVAAITACVAGMGSPSQPPGVSSQGSSRHDQIGVVLEGRKAFVHRLSIPATAEKNVDSLIPFELEALVPVDLEDVVFDYELSGRDQTTNALDILAIAARTAQVRERIDLVREAVGGEPELVGVAPVELAQLASLYSELKSPEPICLIDLSDDNTDVCILENGKVGTTRSISLGTRGFPDAADRLVAQLRQTLAGYASTRGKTPLRAYLLGTGASLDGVHAYFADRLGLPFETPRECALEGITGDTSSLLPRFARALAVAQHIVRNKGLNLRQGELSFQRGFGFFKEKAPLFMGLGAAILISFLFATWAESRALDRERENLEGQLTAVTQAVLGEGTSDPDEALALITQAQGKKVEDPMPYMDGFGVAVALAEAVPTTVVHDVEELDFQKGKITLRGVVNGAEDAQTVAKALEENRCIEGATVSKITQVVNSQRVRYQLEATVRCPEDEGEKKKAPASPAAPAPSGEAP
jgi:general secretion pathway protein L